MFKLGVMYVPKYNTSPGRGIENVTLRNIQYTGKGSPSASSISGYNAERKVKNITIDNVTVAGKRLSAPQNNLLEVNEFTEGVTYK